MKLEKNDTRAIRGRICEENSNLPAVIHRSRIYAFAEIIQFIKYELNLRHPTNGNHCTFYSLPLPENNIILSTVLIYGVGVCIKLLKMRAGFVIKK
jgi:hypothetical protein